MEDFKGLKKIAGIKARRKKHLIAQMKDSGGQVVSNRCSIAEVFASFYEDLYRSKCVVDSSTHRRQQEMTTIEPFSRHELDAEIKNLRKDRCADTNGIVAEMLQVGGKLLTDILLEVYNEIIKPESSSPCRWKETMLSVIHKSGDKQALQNYRPIAIIPILYKLFARLLARRLTPILDSEQSNDQAGFRRGFSTDDHIFTYMQIQEKCAEWQVPVWCAVLDFQKAFDTVEHQSLWNSLDEQGVPSVYIELVQKLYHAQHARVRTDVVSRSFEIQRGTKQGDPLSSLIFNSVLESILRKAKAKWEPKRIGFPLGFRADAKITNLRFADDVILFARTLPQLKQMLADMSVLSSHVGLKLHPGKTKILTNTSQKAGRPSTQAVDICDMKIEILPNFKTTKYLGRLINFGDLHEAELNSRIGRAWKSFMT